MATPETPSDPFYVEPDVVEQFAGALRAAKWGSYAVASFEFSDGLRNIGVPDEVIDDEGDLSEDDRQALMYQDLPLLAADGSRNFGFMHVRMALAGDAEEAPGHYRRAWRLLEISHAIAQAVWYRMGEGEILATNEQSERTIAARGVASALMARAASARYAQLGSIPALSVSEADSRERARAARQGLFTLAHYDLTKGKNSYWVVSNSLVAARDLRVDGFPLRDPDVVSWRNRATEWRQWAAQRDRSNFPQAVKTTVRHWVDTRTPALARAAILSPRRV